MENQTREHEGLVYYWLGCHPSSENHPENVRIKSCSRPCPGRHSCLWLGLLKEGFLDPVEWLDEVDGGAAGEDAPGGEGGDVRGLDAAGGEEAGEGGAGRRESHRRR